MPLFQTDALPYIDPQPSADELAAAKSLIEAELPSEHATTLHASIPALRTTKFSPMLEAEFARLTSGAPKEADTGIDMTRYEALDAPERSNLPAWKETLQRAYTSYEYLRGRETNLGLLETYGMNAWLVGNSHLEDELRSLEREVEAAKVELEQVEQARRGAQESVAGEMQGLEETWRTGVGRMIEAQAAGESLRQEILERRRQGAA